MSKLGKTFSRLAQMGWEERRTRLAQEISKRVDLAFYRCGLLSARNRGEISTEACGNFFFSRDQLPHLATLLRGKMASETESMVTEAEEICRHRFRLLGYDDLDYGVEIDWHLDVVHGKRAPMRPWFKIDFLNSPEVGDHKIIWELNRHQHLVTLATAWCVTQDERYAIEARKQWYSWQKANPYPIGINWASSLEVAFRSLSWIWMLSLLPELDAGGATFREEVICALAANGRYIERNLSTYFSPNTHLLGEATALFFIGTIYTGIAAAGRFQSCGWNILLHEAKRQVRPDGVYFEQSLYYHVYALDFFLHSRVLAANNDVEIPASFDRTLDQMLDVVSALSQAGPAEGFGDDDGGRVFNPRRNRTEHLTDPLALGAMLFQREDLKTKTSLTAEAIWLFGEQAVSFFGKAASPDRTIETKSFNQGGIYVMASGQKTSQQMAIDAGPQGTGRSGHGHADALSVSLTADGRRWLVDPGTFCYMCDQRNRFRGTRAHNTLRVDGLDQAVPEGPFAWSSIPEVRCERWIAGESFTLFAGSHSGYMRLPDPVRHRRHIFHLRDEFWFIRDLADGRKEHKLEIHWHFASGLSVSKIENGFVAEPKKDSLRDNISATRLALLAIEDSGWKSALEANSVSPAYGKKDSASVLRVSNSIRLPAEYATLVLPLSTPGQIGKLSRIEVTPIEEGSAVSAYRYDGDGKSHYMIFIDRRSGRVEAALRSPGQPRAAVPTQAGTWTSDAEFLYFATENGRIVRFILCEGSRVEINGKSVINHPSKIERFECDRDSRRILSSDLTAVESFSPDLVGF